MKLFWGFMIALIAVVILFVLGFAMPAATAWERSFAPARTVTVSAEGKTVATPDEADITFSIVTQGQSPSALSDNNNSKMAAVLQFVASQGIASSDVATVGYNLQPNYQWDKNSQRNYITGYTLTQTVRVKIRDLSKVAPVLGGLAPLGVNQIGSVNYTFQNPDAFVAIARTDAMMKAQEEAAQMAAESGAMLGPVVTVSESRYIPVPQPAYQALGMGMAATAVLPPVTAGTQEVTDNVTVVYGLR